MIFQVSKELQRVGYWLPITRHSYSKNTVDMMTATVPPLVSYIFKFETD